MSRLFPAFPFLRLRVLMLLLVMALAAAARAEAPRVLPPGQLPHDQRLDKLKDLNGYFPFTPCATTEAWDARAEQLRRQLLVATGLWPMPPRTPDHAVIHGKVDRDGYTVEKVYLESFPGHYVTGNLYRPKGKSGKLPGVLCPHGHWPNGRFYDAGEKEIRQSIVEGAERFELSGRYPLQARCVQLARMGCVVFHYDMVGYADSVQLPHRPGDRPSMSGPENWGYFSPQAEARLQHMMGLQTYNSVRALDWFSQLPDVDAKRIGVTGASGGGTQTFILCAIDPRPAVAFPAVMVGTAMQGGCTCENACYLRVGTGNVEIAALIAPRPLGMTAADDWTKEILTKGLPELKQHYRLFGAEDQVAAKALTHFPHNYNYVSRAVMYAWMNKHLKLGYQEPIVEEDFRPLSREEMSVWDETHPKPEGGDAYERSLLKSITEDSDRQMQALIPKDAASLEQYRKIVGGALEAMIGRTVPKPGSIQAVNRQEEDRGDYRLVKMLLRYEAEQEEVPAIVVESKKQIKWVSIWVHQDGKKSLFDEKGNLNPSRWRHNAAVIALDLLGQGEFTPDGKPLAKARLLTESHWDRYLGYTLGYNRPLFVQRVHDILTAISYAKSNWPAAKIELVGINRSGHWAGVARAIAGQMVEEAKIDMGSFRFSKLTDWTDPDFLPGGAKYLDLPGIVALCAPHSLMLYPDWERKENGERNQDTDLVVKAYNATGHPKNLEITGFVSGVERHR